MAAKMIERPVAAISPTSADANEAAAWVLSELGTPSNLLRVEAKPLWDGYFRVNVYTSTDIGLNAKEIVVSDSFFVYRAETGFLSNPPIVRKYNAV